MNIVKVFLLTIAITLVPTYAFSGGSYGDREYYRDRDGKQDRHKHHRHKRGERCKEYDGGGVTAVPEINVGGSTIALALLGGLVLVARERRNPSQG